MRWTLLLLLIACSGTEVASRGAALEVSPALANLSNTARDAVGRSPVPVLLLPERFAAESVVTAGPRWYAVSHHRDHELTVSIHATDVVHHAHLSDQELAAIPAPTHAVRGEDARTGINEGIRYVTWTHEGVSYALEVECWDVLRDARCTDPYWALDLADELVEVAQ